MSKIVEVIENLNNLLALKPATKEDITSIENKLNLTLAEDYKEYLQKYGAILADNIELTGVAKSKNRDVIQVTQKEWELNPNIKHTMYVIENIGIDGIIIWQDATGVIYESKPNCNALKIANSLAEYIASK